jgi:hypothetical protein
VENSTALIGLIGSIGTSVITYFIAKANASKDYAIKREEYVDGRLKELVTLYKNEVCSLKDEIRELVEENKMLKVEILELKEKVITLEGGKYHGEI